MNIITTVIRYILLSLLLVITCAPVGPGGSGTETTTGIIGAVVDNQGQPQAQVQVQLLPAAHDPVRDTNAIPADTTDSLGRFRFMCIDSGEYSVQMVHLTDRTRALISGIHTEFDTVKLSSATLRAPGSMIVSLPEGVNNTTGYVYIPGTTFFTFLKDHTDFVILDSLPAERIPEIVYSSTDQTAAFIIRYNITIFPGDTAVVLNPSWKYTQTIVLNTTPSGADVASNVANFPVLIKLQTDNFDFSQAQSDGSDIRFTKMDNTPLPCEIERWDAARQRAEIWVKVDTVYGNNNAHSIIMYWGNAAVSDPSFNQMVFDTAAGFQGVWHLSDGAADPVHDATSNGYDGISHDTARPQVAEGAVGNCRVFNGITDYISIPNTAGRLDFPQNGKFSVSAWVMADTFINLQQTLISKGKYEYFLWMDSTFWRFWNFQDRAGWQSTEQKATLKQWVLLTAVRDGVGQQLYVNDEPVDSLTLKPDLSPRNTTSDLILGRTHESVAGFCYFKGKIDEVRILSKVPSQDWVRLCYMNQRTDNKLVMYKK
jgi:hypothetical protein